MRYFRIMLSCFVLLLSVSGINAQTSDLQNWSFVKAKFDIDPGFTVDLFPFVRLQNDLSEVQNYSFDIYVKKKLSKHLSLGALSRTIWVPDSDMRQFFFYDFWVATLNDSKRLKFDLRLRYHHGLELSDRYDPDFFRTFGRLTIKLNSKINTTIATENFASINAASHNSRIRYELGLNAKLVPNLSLALMFRKEDVYRQELNINNMIVTGLTYKFAKKPSI